MSNLPIATPAEIISISPECLEIANAYLQEPDIEKVSLTLGVSTDIISNILAKREVKAYIDNVFMDVGYNNRFKLRRLMDTIIDQKLTEMDEAEIGTSKDILEILALSHKMTMEHLDKQIQLEKIRAGKTPHTQVNMQLNEYGGGTNYSNLVERIMKNDSGIK